MSIAVMSAIWKHSQHRGSARLVLLAIGDFADDHGQAFPSVETLAGKARVGETTVHRILRQLIQSGELSITIGGGRKRCNLYSINLDKLAGQKGAKVEGCQIGTVPNTTGNDVKRVPNTTEKGATVGTRSIIEPSYKK